VEHITDKTKPGGLAQYAKDAGGERRLKLAFSKGHQDRSVYDEIAEKRAQLDRLAELGNLAAVFAHEVANPLYGLSASLQFALKDLARLTRGGLAGKEFDVPVIEKTLQGALREVDRLVELLDEFRFAVPPQTLNLKPADLGTTVKEVLALEVTGYESAGITVTMAIEANLPAIEIDGSKIKQAILNLCKNAVQAMPDGGRLAITVYRADDMFVVEITDDGLGVPDDLDVFELFKTTKPGGTGLGLPVAQQIISAHHGSIEHTSTGGSGTKFTVRLPAAQALSARDGWRR
jgi:signal transduction histidine kinase